MRIVGAVILAGIALFMSLGFLGSGLPTSAPIAIVTLFLVVGFPAAGAAMLLAGHFGGQRRLSQRRRLLGHQTVESEILKLAMTTGGRLTAVEVAAHLAMTPEAASEALDRLALRGQADYQVSDAGVIVYSFHDIRHLGGKDSAKDVLDA